MEYWWAAYFYFHFCCILFCFFLLSFFLAFLLLLNLSWWKGSSLTECSKCSRSKNWNDEGEVISRGFTSVRQHHSFSSSSPRPPPCSSSLLLSPSSCWINPSSTFSYLMIWLVSHSILFMSILLCHDFHFLCWFSFPSFYILLMPSASSTSCHGSRLMSIIYLLLYPPPTLPSSTCSLFLPPVLFIYSAGCDGWWIFWRALCCLKPGKGYIFKILWNDKQCAPW